MNLSALATYILNQWLLGKFTNGDLSTLVDRGRITEEHRTYFLSMKEEK